MYTGHEGRDEAREGGRVAGFAKILGCGGLLLGVGCWVGGDKQTEFGRHDVYTGMSTIDTGEQDAWPTMMQKDGDVVATCFKTAQRKTSSIEELSECLLACAKHAQSGFEAP
jgi:hypothetical protein